MTKARTAAFLPMSRAEMAQLGWDELDILLVTGDAYIDHPAFGAPLLGRWLLAHGFRVGLVAQPDWSGPADIARLGRPRLFAGVTAGALDSMLAHYTAFRRKRSDDAYTPGGRAGARPNRATIVYTNLVRQAFPGLPVVIGGIEASMRRATHYDFWDDRMRRSLLLDSKADLLVYGMAERALLEVARRLLTPLDGGAATPGAGLPADRLHGISGTAFCAAADAPWSREPGLLRLPSHEDIVADPRKLMDATLMTERQMHGARAWSVQRTAGRFVYAAPPAEPLSTAELDRLYDLPFCRLPHPSYREPIPAMEMIAFSVTTHRGCAGGCTFCSLAVHQGRRIASRSAAAVKRDVARLTRHPDWKGALSDVGGPSANMWGAECRRKVGECRRVSCLWPAVCGHLAVDQSALTALLADLARLPGVRHVRTASGVRYDLALRDAGYVAQLVRGFVGGQLKLAPEHTEDPVLTLMRKPPLAVFERFMAVFAEHSRGAGKEQYIVPYLISAFPGCRDEDMRRMAGWLNGKGWRPQQVQCFIPLPGTVAAAMFAAGIDTRGHPIHVARSDGDRRRQHAILMRLA